MFYTSKMIIFLSITYSQWRFALYRNTTLMYKRWTGNDITNQFHLYNLWSVKQQKH